MAIITIITIEIRRRFNGKCNYCGIIGHKGNECRKKKREQGQDTNNKKVNQAQEVVLMAGQLYCGKCNDTYNDKFSNKTTYTKDVEYQNNIWICNSGATTHLVNSDEHLMNCTTIYE